MTDRGGTPKRDDPAPEQIAADVAEIQSRWSEAERLRRARYGKPVPVDLDAVEWRCFGVPFAEMDEGGAI